MFNSLKEDKVVVKIVKIVNNVSYATMRLIHKKAQFIVFV